MIHNRVPAAEVPIDAALVRALLAAQHPDLASLPMVDAGEGWDNHLYRLGHDLVVRLPRRALAADLIQHEQRWLPYLAPRLPLSVPVPVRMGRPGCGFPWSWHVAPWLDGETAAVVPPHDPERAAIALGNFVRALHQPAPGDAPANPYRGGALADRTTRVHERVAQLGTLIDAPAVLAAWDKAVSAPAWPGPPIWIHGDFHPGNMLVHQGRISAVIDFGDLTSGDPATDLLIAWMLLPAPVRPVFRASARGAHDAIDDATWSRGRGWAIVLGLILFASLPAGHPVQVIGSRTINAVLDDGA